MGKSNDRKLREDLVLQACLEAYGAVLHEGRLADRALDFVLRRKKHLWSQERRAVAERVYALLRQQRTVEWLLEKSRPGFAGLGSSRKDLLRLAASRVLTGDDVREVAAASSLTPEDLKVMLDLGGSQEKLKKLPAAERYAIQASLPDFLAARFQKEFGKDAVAAAEAMNQRAPLTARVNTLKIDRDGLIKKLREEGVGAEPCPLSPLGVFLNTRINAFSLDTFREGFFEIQDEGSQLLGMLVDAMPTRAADTCAGAGGKTLQLAAQMKNKGELFALDIDERRLEELKQRARRAGCHNVRVKAIPPDAAADAALTEMAGKMDRVLVDAPCSGSGTYRRKPDGRYRITEEGLAEHSARQSELLQRFSVLVKPKGQLIYGTCSVFTEENEAVIDKFLAKNPDFSVKNAAERLGPELVKTVNERGFLRLYPHKHGTDGFFGAILVRKAQ